MAVLFNTVQLSDERLVGAYATKLRHLERLGYEVTVVSLNAYIFREDLVNRVILECFSWTSPAAGLCPCDAQRWLKTSDIPLCMGASKRRKWESTTHLPTGITFVSKTFTCDALLLFFIIVS